jgi:hypothetical protein
MLKFQRLYGALMLTLSCWSVRKIVALMKCVLALRSLLWPEKEAETWVREPHLDAEPRRRIASTGACGMRLYGRSRCVVCSCGSTWFLWRWR